MSKVNWGKDERKTIMKKDTPRQRQPERVRETERERREREMIQLRKSATSSFSLPPPSLSLWHTHSEITSFLPFFLSLPFYSLLHMCMCVYTCVCVCVCTNLWTYKFLLLHSVSVWVSEMLFVYMCVYAYAHRWGYCCIYPWWPHLCLRTRSLRCGFLGNCVFTKPFPWHYVHVRCLLWPYWIGAAATRPKPRDLTRLPLNTTHKQGPLCVCVFRPHHPSLQHTLSLSLSLSLSLYPSIVGFKQKRWMI